MRSGIKHLCTSSAQNDALEATLRQRAGLQSPHREVQSTKERDINEYG